MVSASGDKATLRNVPWIFLGNRVSMGVERPSIISWVQHHRVGLEKEKQVGLLPRNLGDILSFLENGESEWLPDGESRPVAIQQNLLGGGFKYLFSPLLGEMIQFD